MLEEGATVVDCQGDSLWVETISRSSCSHCSSSACSTSVVSKLFGLRRNLLQMQNTLGAVTGDRVVIGIPDAVLVQASIWAYLLPLLPMVLATLLALRAGASDGLQALAALAGLAIGFLFVRLRLERGKRQRGFEPELIRIDHSRSDVNTFKGIRVL